MDAFMDCTVGLYARVIRSDKSEVVGFEGVYLTTIVHQESITSHCYKRNKAQTSGIPSRFVFFFTIITIIAQ